MQTLISESTKAPFRFYIILLFTKPVTRWCLVPLSASTSVELHPPRLLPNKYRHIPTSSRLQLHATIPCAWNALYQYSVASTDFDPTSSAKSSKRCQLSHGERLKSILQTTYVNQLDKLRGVDQWLWEWRCTNHAKVGAFYISVQTDKQQKQSTVQIRRSLRNANALQPGSWSIQGRLKWRVTICHGVL